MNNLIPRQAAIDALEKVAELFPWRVPGNRDSYDRYNEAWNDAIGRAEIEIENLPSAEPEEKVLTEEDYAYCLECNHGEMCKWYPTYGCEFKDRPSAQPYTEDEIQKMQDLEQAQLNKTYQLGYEDGLAERSWVPCNARLPEVHEAGNSFSGVYMRSYPVLVYGVPEYEEECGFHVVTYCDDLNGYTYWVTELDAVRINGVKAWMPLPEPWEGGSS